MGTVIALAVCGTFAAAAFVVLVTRLFHPYHRRVALGVWAVGWIPLGVAVVTHQSQIQAETVVVRGALLGYGPHLGLLTTLIVVGYLVRVLFPSDPTSAPQLTRDELAARVDVDLRQLVYLFDKMDAVLDELQFSALLSVEAGSLSAEENVELRALYARFVEASFELDVLKDQYRSFRSVNPLSETALHARGFLVAYGAYVAEYRAGTGLTHAVGDNDTVKTILNEKHPEHDIPRDSYVALQRQSVHPDSLVRLNVGRGYLKLMKEHVADRPAYERTLLYISDIREMIDSAPEVFIDNPLDYLERVAFDTWFPVQKTVALGIGAVHATHDSFISATEAGATAARLEPGDTLLQRREWHLTNLGIPGYWTHAALYVGTLEKLDRYFDGLDDLEGQSARDYLASMLPDARRGLAEPDDQGRPVAVLEAIGEGVVLTALEKSGSCDALAALSPNISKADRLRAITDALEHLGKPYDYNFDFRTDNQLVCSEVIYKAYHRVDGVELTTESVNGRPLLSPNNIAVKLDLEHDENPQLELRFFLDGTPSGVVERDVAAFRESHRRPKWHILFADE